MALRIYPIRPLRYGRGYYGGQSQASPYAGAFKAGGSMASELVGGIGKAMAAHKAQQQQDQQNALANRLMNTSNPALGTNAPRAGLVSPGVNIGGQAAEPGTPGAAPNVVGANVPQAGTAPFSTGVAGMQLQQQFIKNQLDNQRLAMELRNQGIAANLQARRGGGDGSGGQGNASRWQQYLGGGQGGRSGQVDQFGNPVKAGKPAAYQAGSSTVDDPANYYNFGHQREDIDQQYGKGTYDKLMANSGNISIDPKTGKYVSADPDSVDVNPDTGDVTLKSSSGHAGAHIPFNDLQQNMARYDATLVKQGKDPRFNDQYLKTQNPQSGLPNGDAANPYAPKSTLDLDAIPPGKSFVNPQDGKVYQKQAPQQPAAQQPPVKGTTQVETGAQGGGLAGAQGQGVAAAQPQTQMPSLLQPLAPQTPQQGLAGGDQGQGQDYSGGQPQLSPVAPQGPQAPVDPMAVAASNTPGSFFPGAQPASGGLPSDVDLGAEIARTQLANRLQGVA